MDRFAAKSEGAQATRRGFTLVVHGGAGLLIEENSSPQTWAKYHEGLEDALRAGYRVLAAASSSSSPTSSSSSSPSPSSSSSSQAQPQKLSLAMRAAMAAVASLEDNPLFNAGRGAVLTSEGTHEMDACVMDGRDLSSGAVTNLKCIKNPIFAAEAVRQLTTHAFMGGEGVNEWATQVAKSHPHMQLEVVDNTYFTTERRVLQLKEEQQHSRGESEQKHQQKEGVPQGHAALQDPERHVDAQPLGTAAGSATAAADTKPLGTVGAVCIDSDGNMAAATSTGGRTGKLPGRIGDTPVVGAGTYCDNLTCAISCTGYGEYFQRAAVAAHISARVEMAREAADDADRNSSSASRPPAQEEKALSPTTSVCTSDETASAAFRSACDWMVHEKLPRRLGAEASGGLIAVDAMGTIATPFNSKGMFRGFVREDGRAHTRIWDEPSRVVSLTIDK